MCLRDAGRGRPTKQEARPEHRPREAPERPSIRGEFETVINCDVLVHVRAQVESAHS